MIVILSTCLILNGVLGVESHGFDYYWKDFDGDVPEDALSGGRDINGKPVYIGQSYINEYGLFIGNLVEGVKTSTVPCYGPKTADKLIKILCTHHKNNFVWLPTNNSRFHLDMINKHPIAGGYNHHKGTHGYLHVGRLTYQGYLNMCEVLSYDLENSVCHFVFGGLERSTNNFEALLYTEDNVKTNVSITPQ